MIPVGVTVKKYSNVIIIGAIIAPRSIPNLNHNFFGIFNALGSKMLKLSISKFRKLKNPKKIISTVKKFNKRSQKCFLKVNFKKIKFDKKKHITLSKINLKKENYYELSPR